jgi:predicted nucleotidyltransferase
MTTFSYNFSQLPELARHAEVIAAVHGPAAARGIDLMIAGAFARDLHLRYGHGIAPQRQTEDIDIALAVASWADFAALRRHLIAEGGFAEAAGIAHRLCYRGKHMEMPIDIVPFGGLESPDRKIAWPPSGNEVMDVFGFREALGSAVTVLLPGKLAIKVVSLAALVVLKLNAWQSRHYTAPRKDAYDLQLISKHYLDAGNRDRLWTEFAAWTESDSFDYEIAGARMLGFDAGALLNPEGRRRMAILLIQQTNESGAGVLAGEMNRNDPDRAMKMLRAILQGLVESELKSE